jgi:hypothetical protein
MLRFLSSLFSDVPQTPGGPDRRLVEAAVERVVDATDPRLRGFGDYRKRIYTGAERSLVHVQALIDSLPEPVEMGGRTFGSDPRLRAFFASPGRLRELIANAPSVIDLLAERGPRPQNIFGLLAPQMKEREVLGMELQGDQVRRDVLQRVVDFSDHRFVGASGSEAEARDELKKRAFDFLAELALRRILDMKERKTGLEQQQRLLQRKLDAMQAGNWGLEPMLAADGDRHSDYGSLEQKVEAVEGELMGQPCSGKGLEAHFDCINAILEQPAEWLSLRGVELNIDVMSLRVEDPAAAGSSEPLRFTEMLASNAPRRIVLFGYLPSTELPPERDLLEESRRILG